MTRNLQHARRHDPYPWTWEIPVAVITALLAAVILAAQAGRSLANLVTGYGWTWPGSGNLVTSLVGIVRGDATAGLTTGRHETLRVSGAAGSHVLWASVVATETVALVCLVWLGIVALRRWGPGRMRGMATRAEVDQLLGVRRLRRVAKVVRPDLHPPHRTDLAGHRRLHTQRQGPNGDFR